MALAILLGALAGAIGFVPLVIGLRLVRRSPQVGCAAPMLKLLVSLLVSFIAIFMMAVLFIACDKPNGLPFVLAEVIALSAAAIGYGIWSVRGR